MFAAREKEARDNAKAMAQHTARLGQLQKALDESNWELDTMKRDLNQSNRDKDDLEQKVQRLQRDNASLKKVESNMNGFLKNVMGEKESLNSMGLTPLRLSKASSHGSSSRSSRSLNGADRQNSSRSSNGGNSARSSSSAPDKLHSRKSYTPYSSSKSGKSHSRPSSGSRSRPSSGSRSRHSSARRNKDSKHSNNHGKDRHFDDNGKNGAEDELVLPALPAVGEDVAANVIQRTADFLKSRNKNRGGILHSTSGNIRPVSASNNMNDDDIVFSKRRTKRLHSLDKENISAHKINRAKSAAGRRRQERNQNVTFDAKNGAKKIRPLRKDRPNSAPMQQTPKRV